MMGAHFEPTREMFPRAGPALARPLASFPGLDDLGAEVRLLGLALRAEHREGSNARHHDQGKHDRVLDRCRAILAFQEVHDRTGELREHENRSLRAPVSTTTVDSVPSTRSIQTV